MTRIVTALVLAFGVATTAWAVDPPKPPPPASAFAAQVSTGNMFEIDSSKLAMSRSKNDAILAFATTMVADHTDAAAKFKKAIAEAEVKEPPAELDARHKAVLDNLSKQDAAGFDKAYIQAQYEAHVATVELFESYAFSGDNARMKQFAQELLPVVRAHRDHVAKLR